VRTPVVRLVIVCVAVGVVVVAALLLRADPAPYVVSAIDYHFHDAHPTFPIAPGRDLVVKNVGSNVHNVTIPALEVSSDVAPGEEFTIEDIAGRLDPGRYELVCRYHEDRGMTGVIVIAAS
jgi:plastocyanin